MRVGARNECVASLNWAVKIVSRVSVEGTENIGSTVATYLPKIPSSLFSGPPLRLLSHRELLHAVIVPVVHCAHVFGLGYGNDEGQRRNITLGGNGRTAVSYTHLTLPTIYSV